MYRTIPIAFFAFALVACGGKVENNYYQTFAAPSATSPQPMPQDAGTDSLPVADSAPDAQAEAGECQTDDDCAKHNGVCLVFKCMNHSCFAFERDDDNDKHSLCAGGEPGSYDCDDQDPSIYPEAEEICDNKDNDCDGQVDEGCPAPIQLQISFEGPPGQTMPTGKQGFELMTSDFCVDSTEDLQAQELVYDLGNGTGNLLDPDNKPYFTNIKVMDGDVTVMGPVELDGTLWPSQKLLFTGSYNLPKGSCHKLSLKADISNELGYHCGGCTYKATLRIPTNGNGLVVGLTKGLPLKVGQINPQVDINGNEMLAQGMFAAYCEPSPIDPQGAYTGCCGSFIQTDAAKPGDLIKGKSEPVVYYVASDNKRHVFPTSLELDSWFAPLDSMSVPMHDYHPVCHKVLEMEDATLVTIPLGENITLRPGAFITGITVMQDRFVVDTHRSLRRASPSILEGIYPGTVPARTHLIADSFFINYTMGSELTSADEYVWLLKYPQADIDIELGLK